MMIYLIHYLYKHHSPLSVAIFVALMVPRTRMRACPVTETPCSVQLAFSSAINPKKEDNFLSN